MSRRLFIAGMTVLGAALAPGVASAAVTTTVDGPTMTVTSDGQPDSIVIAVAGGFVKVNATVTTLAAGRDAAIEVDAGGGGDIVNASALPADAYQGMSVNGGPGDDVLIGGQGRDSLTGGDGSDSLNGRGGDDLVSGDAGDDLLFGDGGGDVLSGGAGHDVAQGGDGDDAYAHNEGDGSATFEGDGGEDFVFAGGADVADALVLSPATTGSLFRRTNLVPYELAMSGTEGIELLGRDGDDDVTVAPGLTGLTVAVLGGEGADTLTGGDEADTLLGGPGPDRLTGGGGRDDLEGEAGDDLLFARDRQPDKVLGGDGFDSARTDATTVDAISGIELLDATPPTVVHSPPPPPPTRPVLSKLSVTRAGISFTLSRAATVKLGFAKAKTGRKLGHSCRKPSHANRHRHRCTRFVKVGSLSVQGTAGPNRVSLTRALARGRYRLTATPADAAGNRGTPRTARFKVGRR